MPSRKRIITISLIFYFISQIFFLINIQFPRGTDFDEFHYVPSAKQFLALHENQNWEHPPLGKEMMAVGIAIAGDRPIGWRLMSTVFGALTLAGMFIWGLALFKDEKIAIWIALLCLFNQLLYVQSRIGMLDTFMMAFLVWGLAAFTASWNPKLKLSDTKVFLAFAGVMFGLATACKWFGVIAWFSCLGAIFVVRIFQSWGIELKGQSNDDWYHPDLWKGVRWYHWINYLIAIPLVFYFITFIPYYFIPGNNRDFFDLFTMQKRMWEGQLSVTSSHPYMSTWPDWPFLKRPIWYAFDKEPFGPPAVRGVILLGNPLVMWGGVAAVLACLWGWLSTRGRDAFLIVYFYAAFFGCWLVIPRKISFYYYYYPAGMVLSLALGYVFFYGEKGQPLKFSWPRWIFMAAAVGLFIYFFPILAALRIPADAFRKWMWFNSWI